MKNPKRRERWIKIVDKQHGQSRSQRAATDFASFDKFTNGAAAHYAGIAAILIETAKKELDKAIIVAITPAERHELYIVRGYIKDAFTAAERLGKK